MQILTAQQAKEARDTLKLSQRRVAIDADVSRPTLSLFEQQRALPEDAFLTTLRNFFEAQGFEFADLDDDAVIAEQEALAGETDSPPPVARLRGSVDFRLRDGIAVLMGLPEAEAEVLLEQLAEVEQEIAELQARPVSLLMFGGPSEKSRTEQDRLRLLMARSFCLMQALRGRKSIEPCTEVVADLEEGGGDNDQGTWVSQVFGDLFGNAPPDAAADELAQAARPRTNLLGATRSRPRENFLVAENDG